MLAGLSRVTAEPRERRVDLRFRARPNRIRARPGLDSQQRSAVRAEFRVRRAAAVADDDAAHPGRLHDSRRSVAPQPSCVAALTRRPTHKRRTRPLWPTQPPDAGGAPRRCPTGAERRTSAWSAREPRRDSPANHDHARGPPRRRLVARRSSTGTSPRPSAGAPSRAERGPRGDGSRESSAPQPRRQPCGRLAATTPTPWGSTAA